MGLITGEQFIPIADRLARQAIELEDAVLYNQSGTSYYVRVHGKLCEIAPGRGDFEIESDLISPANSTDEGMVFAPGARAYFTDLVNGLNNHVGNRGTAAGITTMDDYLNKSGINVHELYNEAQLAVTGSTLDAVNVYRDDQILMGEISLVSSGVGTFTDGERLGTGTGDFVRDTGPTVTPNSAEQNIEYCTPSGIGFGSDLDVRVLGKNEQGNTVTDLVTISAGTTSGVCDQFGPDGFKLLDVTSIQFAGGNPGDIVTIKSIVERNVGL